MHIYKYDVNFVFIKASCNIDLYLGNRMMLLLNPGIIASDNVLTHVFCMVIAT